MIKKISQLNRLPKEFYDEKNFGGSAAEKKTFLRKKNDMLFEVSYETADTSNPVAADEVNYYTSYSTTLSALGDMLGTNELRELLSTIIDGGLSVISGELKIGLPCPLSDQVQDRCPDNYRPDKRNGGSGYTLTCYSPFNLENNLTAHGTVDFHNNVVLCCNDANALNQDKPILHVGGVSVFDNTIYGTAYRAQWGDLAEIYSADEKYEPGTLVKFGGSEEITIAKDKANGVVTWNPAIVLNEKEGKTMKFPTGVALVGRVPIKVRGPVRKFDKIVLSHTDPGIGVVYNFAPMYEIVGRALEENLNKEEKLVMCAAKMNLI